MFIKQFFPGEKKIPEANDNDFTEFKEKFELLKKAIFGDDDIPENVSINDLIEKADKTRKSLQRLKEEKKNNYCDLTNKLNTIENEVSNLKNSVDNISKNQPRSESIRTFPPKTNSVPQTNQPEAANDVINRMKGEFDKQKSELEARIHELREQVRQESRLAFNLFSFAEHFIDIINYEESKIPIQIPHKPEDPPVTNEHYIRRMKDILYYYSSRLEEKTNSVVIDVEKRVKSQKL